HVVPPTRGAIAVEQPRESLLSDGADLGSGTSALLAPQGSQPARVACRLGGAASRGSGGEKSPALAAREERQAAWRRTRPAESFKDKFELGDLTQLASLRHYCDVAHAAQSSLAGPSC